MATTKQSATIDIIEMSTGLVEFYLIGTSPFICNAMSAKVKSELLFPKAKTNRAEMQSRLKHNPMQEFTDSMYKSRDPDSPTRIVMKATAFKASMMGAALDIPGSSKRQIGRLTHVLGDEIPIFGVPQMMMSVTRMADMSRTPDIRTRAIIPHWAAKLTVEFAQPILKDAAIVNLMAAAGRTQGIGDWRPEKGSGNFGQFVITNADDQAFLSIIANGSKEAQDAAIADPENYDSETDELRSWFDTEVKRRGFKVAS